MRFVMFFKMEIVIKDVVRFEIKKSFAEIVLDCNPDKNHILF
jgi:hypothetical protein